MVEKKPNTVTINGTEYTEDQLTEQQKLMVDHIADLDRKVRTAQFNLDQLGVGREAFLNMLTASLAEKPDE